MQHGISSPIDNLMKTTLLKDTKSDSKLPQKYNEQSIEIEYLKGNISAYKIKMANMDDKDSQITALNKEIKSFDQIREDLRKNLESASQNL